MKPALVVAVALLLTACATPKPLYTWGSYEELIYASYNEPGKVPPEQQIELLEKEYQKARASNSRVPPGWHAHLGVLYAAIGKADQAQQEFRTEKAEFPESTVFVDRLLANMSTP
jgi:hypothetical protein